MKTELITQLEELLKSIESLQKTIRAIKTPQVSPNSVQDAVKSVCLTWTDQIHPCLSASFTDCQSALPVYHERFMSIHKMSGRFTTRNVWEKTLSELRANFRDELITPVVFALPSKATVADLEDILSDVSYPDQKGYLGEALQCAQTNCFRAATVLGWCAAMHQIHCKIEEVGFSKFNDTKNRLSSDKKGRFKRFDGMPDMESMSDLRETGDRKILIVLDGMGLIDSNQRQRLDHCLDLRIHCSHPGDAPLTVPNLVSFFSDLSEIIFKNVNLSI